MAFFFKTVSCYVPLTILDHAIWSYLCHPSPLVSRALVLQAGTSAHILVGHIHDKPY